MVEDLKKYKWLFICAYGESRSVYFAEKFNEMGIKATFDGDPVKIEKLEWADKVVVLDRYVYKECKVCFDAYCKEKIIKKFIDDVPKMFATELDTFIKEMEIKLDS